MSIKENIKNSVANAVVGKQSLSLRQKNGIDIYDNDNDSVNVQNDVSIKDELVDNSVEEVHFKGKHFDRRVDDGQVAYDRTEVPAGTITGAATYDSSTQKVTYSVTLTYIYSWSYQAINQTTGADTGEIAVTSGNTAESGVLGAAQDGVWNVTFRGYNASGELESTAEATVTVATPVPPAEEVYQSSGFTMKSVNSEIGWLGDMGTPRPITLEAEINGNKYRWAIEMSVIDVDANSSNFAGLRLESTAADSQHQSVDPETGEPFTDGSGMWTTGAILNTALIGRHSYRYGIGTGSGYTYQYFQPTTTYGRDYFARVMDPDDIGWKHHWHEPEFWKLPQLWNEPYTNSYGQERKTAKFGIIYGPMNISDYPATLYNGMTTVRNGIVEDYDNLYTNHSRANWDASSSTIASRVCPVVGFWERVGDDLLITPSTSFAWDDGRLFSLRLGLAGVHNWCALGVPVIDGETGPGTVYDWVKTYYNTPAPPEPPPESYYRYNFGPGRSENFKLQSSGDVIVHNGDQIQIVQTMNAVVPEQLYISGPDAGEVQYPPRPAETFELGVDAIELIFPFTFPDQWGTMIKRGYTIVEIGPNTTQGVTALSGSQASFNGVHRGDIGSNVPHEVNYQISWDLSAGTVTIEGLDNLEMGIRIYRAPVPPGPARSPAFSSWAKLGSDDRYAHHPDVAGSLDYDSQAQQHHRIPGWFTASESERRELSSIITEGDHGLSWKAYKQTPEERINSGWSSSMEQAVRRTPGSTTDTYTASKTTRRAWPSFM